MHQRCTRVRHQRAIDLIEQSVNEGNFMHTSSFQQIRGSGRSSCSMRRRVRLADVGGLFEGDRHAGFEGSLRHTQDQGAHPAPESQARGPH